MPRHSILALTERMKVFHDAMSLKGKTILITRQREQSEEFVAEIEKRGGRAVVIPMIRITDPDSWKGCDRALDSIDRYDAIVFTSFNTVAKFFHRLKQNEINAAEVARLDVYAVGEKTKEEIEQRGVVVRFVPETFSAAALADFFKGENVKGKRFLLPKGNFGKKDLATTLNECGAVAEYVDVYTNNVPDKVSARGLRDRTLNAEFDIVTFASPSAAKNFAAIISPAMFAKIQGNTKIAVIGPTTKHAALNLNFSVDIEAKESTSKGLVEAISEFYSQTKNRER